MPHPGFKNAIFQAVQHSNSNSTEAHLLRAFLHGEKVTAAQLKSPVYMSQEFLNERNAEAFIKTLIESLNILGLSGFMLLFDEE